MGIDVLHYWHKRGYSFWGAARRLRRAGDTAAMRRTQLTSAHYFQRPDRKATSDGLFDTRTTRRARRCSGYGFYARLAKESGDWLWETAQNWRSPGFEVNDIAALGRTDYKWMQANVLRQWTKPGQLVPQTPPRSSAASSSSTTTATAPIAQGEVWGRDHASRTTSTSSGFVIHHPPTFDAAAARAAAWW